MGSRIKSLFASGEWNRSTNSGSHAQVKDNGRGRARAKGNPGLRGYAYENVVAREPPLKGSYPVAGNGPNPLDEIQRARVRRNSPSNSSVGASDAAPAPDIPRRREDVLDRPKTARPRGAPDVAVAAASPASAGKGEAASSPAGRPRRMSIFTRRLSRRGSIQSTASSQTETIAPPPVPQSSRDLQAYRPSSGDARSIDFTPSPPATPRARSSLKAPRRTHVDILDAQSHLNPSREDPEHQTQTVRVNKYGEDVADRNLRVHYEGRDQDSRSDARSPELSYPQPASAPRKKGGHPRVDLASAGDGNGDGNGASDDTPSARPQVIAEASRKAQTHTGATPIPSTASQSRPAAAWPPRIDSASAGSYTVNRGLVDAPANDTDARSPRKDQVSSPSGSASQPKTQPPPRDPRRHSFANLAPRVSSNAPGQRRHDRQERPPVPPSPKEPQSDLNTSKARSSNDQQRIMPSSQSTMAKNATGPGHESIGSSASPESNQGHPKLSEAPKSATKHDYIVEGAQEAPSLEGIVDLTNTEDTEVTTRILPAVTHEHVTPKQHEIREEVITRELHTHDVYHRVLPILETEILPTKHYVKSPDNRSLVEIPETQVARHSISGRPNGNWKIIQDDNSSVDLPTALYGSQQTAYHPPAADAADAPLVGFTRPEPRSRDTGPRNNSMKSISSRGKATQEPILSSKKEYTTKEGIPRTEYIWRHPPKFETADGKTSPVYVGAGIGDLSAPADSDEENEGAFGAAQNEEALLFRDSGYGSGGMLPGLQEQSPMASLGQGRGVVGSGEGLDSPVGRVKVDGKAEETLRRKPVGEEAESDAAKARRRSRGLSGADVTDVEGRLRNLSMRH